MDRERYVSFSFRFFSRKRGGDQICLRWSRFLLAHWLAIISIFFSLGGLISEIRDKPYGKFTLFFKVLFLFVSEGGRTLVRSSVNDDDDRSSGDDRARDRGCCDSKSRTSNEPHRNGGKIWILTMESRAILNETTIECEGEQCLVVQDRL